MGDFGGEDVFGSLEEWGDTFELRRQHYDQVLFKRPAQALTEREKDVVGYLTKEAGKPSPHRVEKVKVKERGRLNRVEERDAVVYFLGQLKELKKEHKMFEFVSKDGCGGHYILKRSNILYKRNITFKNVKY